MVGRTFLHYQVLAPLGSGGFGRVFLALDEHTGRRVALKFLDASLREGNKPDDLQREARAASRLIHPGIVVLHGLEQCDGEWFLVEEYVDGENLEQRLRRGPLGGPEMLRLAAEMTAALAHAHGQGVLHRDLKPANILVTPSGNYKLADFGLARLEDATRSDSALLKGTLPYIAPERVRGHRGDAQADLFSLGAVLYEAMSGRRAFSGASEAEVVYALLNEKPTSLETRSADLEPLARTIDLLLAKEPRDRPASARQVAELLSGKPGTPSPVARPRGRPRVHWALYAMAATVLVLFLLRGQSSEPGPIAVIEFQNLADTRDTTRLGLITSNLLTSELATSVGTSIMSTERVIEAMQGLKKATQAGNPGVAREVAQRTRASWIVTGSILRTEPSLLMTAELSEVTSGRIMEAVRVEALHGQTVFEVADQVARKLVAKLVRFARPESLRGHGRRTTKNLSAYQRYVEGLEYEARGELLKAEIAYQMALSRDPDFELAQERLAVIAWRKSLPAEREAP